MNYLIIFIICNAKMVLSANVKMDPRTGKLFTFNSEKEDLEVALEFSIPFVKIPIKDKLDGVAEFGFPGLGFPRINVNPTAIALGGMLLLLTGFISPLFSKNYGFTRNDRSSRDSDSDKLDNNNMDIAQNIHLFSGGCLQRMACWINQKSSDDTQKVWQQVLRNELLSVMVNTTGLVEASANGRSGFNCESYSPCPIRETNLPKIIHSFNILMSARNQNT